MFTSDHFIVSLRGEGLLGGKQLAFPREGLVYFRHREMRFLEGGRNQILKTNATKPDTLPLGRSRIQSGALSSPGQWGLNEGVMWVFSLSLGLSGPASPAICSSSSVTGTIHPQTSRPRATHVWSACMVRLCVCWVLDSKVSRIHSLLQLPPAQKGGLAQPQASLNSCS